MTPDAPVLEGRMRLLGAATAREFPALDLIVARAGAGFIRETLFLAYHWANVVVDPFGYETWMRYMPRPVTLPEMPWRLVEAFGPDRILYGTDSRHASE